MATARNVNPGALARSALLTIATLLALAACGAGGGRDAAPTRAGVPVATVAAATPAQAQDPAASSEPAATSTPTEPAATPAQTDAPAATPAVTPKATPGATPKATPVAAGGTVKLSKYGFRITLPKGWWKVDLSGGDLAQILDQLPEGSVGSEYSDTLAELVAAGLKLLAFDTQVANLGANVSLAVGETEIPAAVLHRTASLALAAMGVTDVRLKDVKVDGEAALRADYTSTQPVDGAEITYTGTQLYIPYEGRTLVVTILTPVGGQTADRDSLIRSIRLD
jgi:hypothetical protein